MSALPSLSIESRLKPGGFLKTQRRDTWWLQPVIVISVLGGFIIYATWAAFQGANYHFGPYLSPFYSPEILGDSSHSWFGPKPSWWPAWLPFSPALLILWLPAGFRFTCYYYRGAYYKAFWADPPACTIGEPRSTYWGEARLPLLFQNLHRYFLYLSLIFIAILAHDAWKAYWFTASASAGPVFGVGIGSLVLTLNVVLLGGYTLGCHSLRHLIGGRNDCISGGVACKFYDGVSCLNRKHMVWAWMSLVWVAFSDLYVRLCAMGVWSDWRLF
ncbi:MAG: succinate dehydrogenase [Proteobacteria bacterium]|nr:MAG: succinate dehydrogenase [Pseudomonadota bacterium]